MTRQDDPQATTTQSLPAQPLADWLIRDLVDAYPATMSLLEPLGLDLCCGGAHPLGEALDLHGIDRDAVLPRIAGIVASTEPEE